ncbi:MAG: NAD(P)H-dependent oxidoreductase, partial [Candidatus Omnitrophica bacterium]|nr:NAD(P)H-dependent oxidoreductase [Candidatus Omnitrophota bacterium]
MLDADGLIIASPNSINQVTASMTALFDRSGHFIHCKRLLDKYIAGVVTSGSGQNADVLDYIKFYGHICGAQYSGGVSGMAQLSQDKKEEAFRLGRRLSVDIKGKEFYDSQMEIIERGKEHFRRIICQRKEDWPEEYAYWVERGWLS